MLTLLPSITGIWIYGLRTGTTRRGDATEREDVATSSERKATPCEVSAFTSKSNVAYQSDCFQFTQTQPSKVHRRRKSEDADVFLAALQTCGAAAELFTLITPLLMAAGCQSGCRSLQALMWPGSVLGGGGGSG